MNATQGSPMRLYVVVWIGLLLIVGVEVALTYAGLQPESLFHVLFVLALIEAGVGVMYFMRLRFERRLAWSLLPAIIFVLFMMNHVWPDAHRLLQLRVNGP